MYLAQVGTTAVFEVQPRNAAHVELVHQQPPVQPQMRLRRYSDLYGNPCVRLILPAARSVLRYDAVTLVPVATEDTNRQARQLTPEDLPDDVLIRILSSRFCPPDLRGPHRHRAGRHAPTWPWPPLRCTRAGIDVRLRHGEPP